MIGNGMSPALTNGAKPQRAWWKDSLIYQIYPRSFMDSNGDGVGDLPGVTARLDHLKALSIDAVWLSPHFSSPNADNGYDISDYRSVLPAFGTMDDFDAMLAGMKQRDIRLIVDLVVNHTSDEHEWFVESRKSRDNPYRDFYIWRDGKDGGPPNNYPSFFGGSAWEKDETTDQWYLHYFHRKQPDLNWDNPRVREAVYDIMRFWLDKGVSGFRMDVIPLISKQTGLPDLTPEQLRLPEAVYANGPNRDRYLEEMHDRVLRPYDAVAIGEAIGVTPEGLRDLVDDRNGKLSLAFSFDIPRIGRENWRQHPWTLPQWKAMHANFAQLMGTHGWPTVYLENHDNPRSVSKFGDMAPEWRARSAKVLATLILTQIGTPFIYQGQEIGMANYPFRSIDAYEDIEAHGFWQDYVETDRVSAEAFLPQLAQTSRDNARTPVQWSDAPQAGFTTGTPWQPVNPDYTHVNVAGQAARPDSVLSCYRDLARLRQKVADLRTGDYEDLAPDDEDLFVYRRGAHVIVLNMSRNDRSFDAPEGASLVFVTDPVRARLSDDRQIQLGGWQALIFNRV